MVMRMVMRMISRFAGRTSARSLVGRLLLALLLAGNLPFGSASAAPAATVEPDGMPCHTQSDPAMTDGATPPAEPCPHCASGEPGAACPCCGHGMPPGLGSPGPGVTPAIMALTAAHRRPSDNPLDVPRTPPFRPPI